MSHEWQGCLRSPPHCCMQANVAEAAQHEKARDPRVPGGRATEVEQLRMAGRGREGASHEAMLMLVAAL